MTGNAVNSTNGRVACSASGEHVTDMLPPRRICHPAPPYWGPTRLKLEGGPGLRARVYIDIVHLDSAGRRDGHVPDMVRGERTRESWSTPDNDRWYTQRNQDP